MIINWSAFPMEIYSRPEKVMLGIAIGDAYGAGFEFRFPTLAEYQNLPFDKYLKSKFPDSPNHDNHFPGMYTDDTQMSIAVTELLISDKNFTRENLADKFVECYKRHRINGYAQKFQSFLDSVNSGKEFIEKIEPNSIRNGAAMRSVPIGLVDSLDKVIDYATINASLTHNTPKGIASSVTVALLSHFAYYSEDNCFQHFIKDNVHYTITPIVRKIDPETADYLSQVVDMKGLDTQLLLGEKHATKGVPCDGMRTAGAAVYLLSNFTSSTDILKEAVKLGGDVDSVASISLGIGLMHEYMCSVPKFLTRGLTNYLYGREYVRALGRQLEHKFPAHPKKQPLKTR